VSVPVVDERVVLERVVELSVTVVEVCDNEFVVTVKDVAVCVVVVKEMDSVVVVVEVVSVAVVVVVVLYSQKCSRW